MEQKKSTRMNMPKVAENKGLLPLIFEMGRMMKVEIHRDGTPIPSFLHMETLRFIEEKGNPSMREVAEYLKIAPPSATALVNAFVKEGVIDRSADPDDRRIVRLSISKKGACMLEKIANVREQAFARLFGRLSAHDRAELARILTILTRTP